MKRAGRTGRARPCGVPPSRVAGGIQPPVHGGPRVRTRARRSRCAGDDGVPRWPRRARGRTVARAHHGWLEVDAPDRAARQACWLGLQLLLRGEGVRAGAWYARAAELVDGRDLPERGFLLVPEALRAIDEVRLPRRWRYRRDRGLGDRFGELDLQAFGRLLRGQVFIAADRIAPGMESLDEAMVAVSADGVSPLATGIVYCAVIEACSAVFDLRRAREWTTACPTGATRSRGWCRTGEQCLVHRAEIMQLQGSWPEAVDEARQACTLLDGRPAIGMAYYQLAECTGCAASSSTPSVAIARPADGSRLRSPVWRCCAWHRTESKRPQPRAGERSPTSPSPSNEAARSPPRAASSRAAVRPRRDHAGRRRRSRSTE